MKHNCTHPDCEAPKHCRICGRCSSDNLCHGCQIDAAGMSMELAVDHMEANGASHEDAMQAAMLAWG